MFAKFKYNLNDNDYINEYVKEGTDIFLSQRKNVKGVLESYILPDGSLDAEKIEDDWFPAIDAQIFLSHSHADEDRVKAFAGWLRRKYGIVSFIDSTVWGYANDLLKQMVNKYCRGNDGNLSYDLTVQSAAHVHMLLQCALAKMINRCECLIFVNSPNSVKPKDIKNKELTGSPWIYDEILMATTFPPRPLEDHRSGAILEHSQQFSVNISYPLNLGGFKTISKKDFTSAELRIQKSGQITGVEGIESKGDLVLEQLYVDKGILSKKLSRRS